MSTAAQYTRRADRVAGPVYASAGTSRRHVISSEVLRVQVHGADPGHAEREARELRDTLRALGGGVAARFEPAGPPQGPGADRAKGQALLTPEVVLLVTGGSFAVLRAAIKGWVDVRKSRHARIEYPDGASVELRGGVSGRELKQLRDSASRPQGGGEGDGRGGGRGDGPDREQGCGR